MFSTAGATVANATDCRFWITSKAGLIARGGTFTNCRTSLTTNVENAQSFNVLTGGLLRIFGGEHNKMIVLMRSFSAYKMIIPFPQISVNTGGNT